jgi:hypothetical protein
MPTDPIHDKPLYPSDNPYGIPTIHYTPIAQVPDWLLPYRHRVRPGQSVTGGAVHFFLFDALFESVWNRPQQALRYLEGFKAVLTPDFSLNVEMPLAVQIWNTYRSRWCGAHWQAQGYTVIPTVGWSTPESYAFCFAGLAAHSPVALTTLGARSTDNRATFLHGFDALIERIKPSIVLCYGDPLPEITRVPLQVYPDHWHNLKAAKQAAHRG